MKLLLVLNSQKVKQIKGRKKESKDSALVVEMNKKKKAVK